MLLISRKQGESILLGEEIVLKVLEVRGGRVRLGFEAPRWIEIFRAECLAVKDSPPESVELTFTASADE